MDNNKFISTVHNTELDSVSLYELVEDNYIKRGKNTIALEYYGTKISYEEFFGNVEKYSVAFLNMGIRPGNVVSFLTPNTPEVFYATYALNKIGAVCNFIDSKNDSEKIVECINKHNSKKLIMLDTYYLKLKDYIAKTNIERVLTVSKTESLPPLKKVAADAYKISKNLNNICPNNDLYKSLTEQVIVYNRLRKEHIDVEPKKNEYAIIVNTYGKEEEKFSNDFFNRIAVNYFNKDFPYEVEDKFLGIIPNCYSDGFGIAMHMPLVNGLKNIIISGYSLRFIVDILKSYKPEHYAVIPDLIKNIYGMEQLQKLDLSFIKTISTYESKYNHNERISIDEFFKSHNSNAKLRINDEYTLELLKNALNDNFLYNIINSVEKKGIDIIRPDGHIVGTKHIEAVAESHPCIEKCIAVGCKSKYHKDGEVPIAFIKLKPGCEEKVFDIVNELNALAIIKFSDNRDRALDYYVIDEVPLKENGEIDYQELKDSYIYDSPVLTYLR